MLSGTLAGLVVGIGARLAMRIVALIINLSPGFSLDGTLNIIAIGMVLGVTPGMMYAAVGRRLPGPPMLRGLAFGVLIFLVLEVYPLVVVSGFTEPAIRPLWLRWGVFGSLSIAYGLAVGAAEVLVDRTMPAPAGHMGNVIGYVLLAVWGLGTTGMFLATLAGAELGVGPLR
jgi:hypothetical protein